MNAEATELAEKFETGRREMTLAADQIEALVVVDPILSSMWEGAVAHELGAIIYGKSLEKHAS